MIDCFYCEVNKKEISNQPLYINKHLCWNELYSVWTMCVLFKMASAFVFYLLINEFLSPSTECWSSRTKPTAAPANRTAPPQSGTFPACLNLYPSAGGAEGPSVSSSRSLDMWSVVLCGTRDGEVVMQGVCCFGRMSPQLTKWCLTVNIPLIFPLIEK